MTMEQTQTTPEDWITKLIRDYQDTITRGAFEGIYQLDEKGLNTVMEGMARTCAHAFVKLYDIAEDLDLDSFLAKMTAGGTSKIHIQRDGNTILWDEQHEGQCMCPFIRRNVIPLKPSLCVCALHWLRMLIEPHVDKPVRVEMLDSVAQGSQNCVFRITIED